MTLQGALEGARKLARRRNKRTFVGIRRRNQLVPALAVDPAAQREGGELGDFTLGVIVSPVTPEEYRMMKRARG